MKYIYFLSFLYTDMEHALYILPFARRRLTYPSCPVHCLLIMLLMPWLPITLKSPVWGAPLALGQVGVERQVPVHKQHCYWVIQFHHNDVIMSTIASQITSLTIVYSSVYSGADQRLHQSSASLASVLGIHRGPVNSPHKWPVTRKMFPFDDVIM